jgi:hypothetical protein
MRPRLALIVESLRKVVGRADRVEVPRREAPGPDSRWKDPVPVVKDRDGHLHVLF